MGKNTETSEVDVIINGQRAYNSIKDLEKAMREYKAIARSTEDNVVREKAIEQHRRLAVQQREFNEQLRGSNTLWSKMTDGIKSFGAAAGLAIGANEVVGFFKDVFKAFTEAEDNAMRLKVAVGVNGGLASAFKELMDQSDELQKITIFSDDTIQQTQTMGLQFGLTSQIVKDLIPVVTDFATATGQDLNSAMEAVLKGVEGNGKGLKLYGIEVDSNATKATNLSSITQQLNERFYGQAKILGGTTIGELKKLGNAFDQLKEDMGGWLVEAGNFIAKSVYAATNMRKYVEVVANEGRVKALEAQAKTDELFQQGVAEKLTKSSTKWLETRENQLLTEKKKFNDKTTNEEIHRNALTLQVVESMLKERRLMEILNQKEIKETKEKITKKAAEDLGKIELEQDLKNLQHWYDVQKLATMQNYADGKISEEEYQKQLSDIQKQYLVLKLFNQKQYNADTVETEQQLAENVIKVNEKTLAKYKDQVKSKKNEFQQEQEALNILLMTGVSVTGETVEQMIAHLNKLISETGKGKPKDDMLKNMSQLATAVSNIWQNINKIRENNATAQLDREKRSADAEEKHLKFLLDKKIITQAQYDKKVEALQEKQDKAQRKVAHDVAVRNRNMGIFNATISTAEAVAGALSMKPWGPWNIPLSIAAGVAGLVEIEEIRNTPIPELGKGKRFTGIGKHPYSTKKIFEPSGQASIVEDGETLLSASTSQNNPIVDALLDASLNNNGRLNGSHPAVEQQFPQVNSRRISETASLLRQSYVSSFADGGGSLNGYGVRNKEGSTSSSEMAGLLRNVHDVLSDLRENGVEANLNYVKFNRDKKRLDSITGASN